MPKYTFVGDTPKALVHTTPPHPELKPGDVFEVAEDLESAEFELVGKSKKAAAEPTKEDPS